MERSRIRELHDITDISNVASMLERGILSHRLAGRAASGHPFPRFERAATPADPGRKPILTCAFTPTGV